MATAELINNGVIDRSREVVDVGVLRRNGSPRTFTAMGLNPHDKVFESIARGKRDGTDEVQTID